MTKSRSFFHRLPTAIILWTFGIIFGLIAVFSLWLAVRTAQGDGSYRGLYEFRSYDSGRMVNVLIRGGLENALISGLCILGWYYCIRRRLSNFFLTGAFAVALAFLITSGRWLYWALKGQNPGGWIEPVFVWPFLAYAIIYAYRESRAQDIPCHNDNA